MSVTDGSKHEMNMEKAREMEKANEHRIKDTGMRYETAITPSDDLTDLRVILRAYIGALQQGRKSRERSLVVTKLEEAEMWAQRATATE